MNGPCQLAGRFEDRFLALPRELLISVLQDHQRYFPVEGADGRLLPWFITVSNVASTRHGRGARRQRTRGAPAPVRCGRSSGRRIARRRWPARLAQLDTVTFQAQLGSIGDKVRRIAPLARAIAARIDGDGAQAERAALLGQVRPGHSPRRRIPRAAGHHGAATTRPPMASPRKFRRPLPSTTSPAARAMTRPCRRPDWRSRSPIALRYPHRHLRHRPEAQRHEGSLRAATARPSASAA